MSRQREPAVRVGVIKVLMLKQFWKMWARGCCMHVFLGLLNDYVYHEI